MLFRNATLRQAPGSVILVIALGFYAVYQINFLIDPWSSWVHIESAYYDEHLRGTVIANSWAAYSDVIFAQPIRLRQLMQAVELADSYLRPAMVATFGFLPALANASSILYFALCPFLAVLIARRLIGSSAVSAVIIVLAVGAFLTSVGYISSSIFIFHPAKKLVIFETLVAWLVFLQYMQAPQPRYVIVIGALQFAMALTDEVGLSSGGLLCALVAGYVMAFRRESVSHLGWLVGFGVATVAAFAYRWGTNWAALDGGDLFGGESLLDHVLKSFNAPDTNFDTLAKHLAGAFSSFYGFSATKFLFLFGLGGATAIAFFGVLPSTRARIFTRATTGMKSDVAEAGFLFLGALVLLLSNAIVSVLLLQFGGSLHLTAYNYYYANTLPVFAFFIVCAAFRLTAFAVGGQSPLLKLAGWSVQFTLAVALGLALAANVVDMPRVNRLVGMIHNNPYGYGAINEAGNENLRRMSAGSPADGDVMRIPRCSEAAMTRRFTELVDQLGITDTGIREAYLAYPSRPFVGERYLNALIVMMLRRSPKIEMVPAADGQC